MILRVEESADRWFAVRCVFRFGADTGWSPPNLAAKHSTYEERVTLWQARSDDHAVALAEQEAIAYAGRTGCEYLQLAQAYQLVEAPTHGEEVFSLMRDSEQSAEDYLDSYFDTGTERQQPAGDAPP